jgi:hypothetical protein
MAVVGVVRAVGDLGGSEREREREGSGFEEKRF